VRVLVALRFALVPQAAKVVDHALESLDVGHSGTISSTGHVDPRAPAHAAVGGMDIRRGRPSLGW
jgi:hypothetical protein